MANTEGIPDEKLASLLSLDDDTNIHSSISSRNRSSRSSQMNRNPQHHRHGTNIPRGLIERQRMMDAYHGSSGNSGSGGGGDMQPSAKVIRSSNARPPPTIVKSNTTTSTTTSTTKGVVEGRNNSKTATAISVGSSLDFKHGNDKKQVSFLRQEQEQQEQGVKPMVDNSQNTMLPPAILSSSIQERPILITKTRTINPQDNIHHEQTTPKKVSRFKMRQQRTNHNHHHNQPTDKKDEAVKGNHNSSTFPPLHKTGFPSFDNIPVGSLTKKGNTINTNRQNNPTKIINTNERENEVDRMIANMSKNEVQENINELKDMLSNETIAFLKNRRKKKEVNVSNNTTTTTTTMGVADKKKDDDQIDIPTQSKTPLSENAFSSPMIQREKEDEDENDASMDIRQKNEKEQMGRMLSNIKTEEELDALYAKSMGIEVPHQINPSATPSTTINTTTNTSLEQLHCRKEHGSIDNEVVNNDESEIEKATKLLRSTVLRQRLLGAKSIHEILLQQRLHAQQQQQQQQQQLSDYPKLLPVALRCLLDIPSPMKHTILLSYVLQSIHSLIILFAPDENHVYVNTPSSSSSKSNAAITQYTEDPKAIHQLWFMDDYIPTPSSRNLYTSSNIGPQSTNGTDRKIDDGCYATDSSAESAEKDSMAFYNDPLWTLLSRMKILPCIAHILSAYSKKNVGRDGICIDKEMVLQSVESISSICGILAMLSVRSPGAACAIAQHKTILPMIIAIFSIQPNLTEKMDSPSHDNDNDSFVVHTQLAFPAIRFICTLCRQSRTAATSTWIPSVMDSITMILATKSMKRDEWNLQRWSIILWRTLLRYGLAISYTSTILPMSIADLTMQIETEYSLSSYYLSTYAVICNCAKASKKDEKVEKSLNDLDKLVLDGCSMWLASHMKSCVEYLCQLYLTTYEDEPTAMRLASARITLLHSYTSAGDHGTTDGTLIPIISREAFINALKGVVQAKLLHRAIIVCLNSFDVDENESTNHRKLACACSLVYSFFTSLGNLFNEYSNRQGGESRNPSDDNLLRLVADIFDYVLSVLDSSNYYHEERASATSYCIRSWRNKAHFAMGKLMTKALTSDLPHIPDSALPITQSFCFTLIGKLDRGEEAMAAMLLSQGVLFDVKVGHESNSIQSMNLIQEVMLREIMDTSNQSQTQLDHSFKLIGGLEETSHLGGGPFLLESLRSEADRSVESIPSSDPNEKFEVLSLPLGHDWLYKLLCGKIDLGEEPQQKAMRLQGTSSIVISALKLIAYMEDDSSLYTKHIPSGSKLYFMLNACLFPEEIIRHDSFRPLFYDLFLRYYLSNDQTSTEKTRSFIVTSFRHSSYHHQRKDTSQKIQNKNHSEITEDQILALFFDTRGGEEKKMKLSPKDLKALDDFLSDLCTAFTNYGAQYDFFCTSIRFLLTAGFPTRNRIIILNHLKDLLHLLTTETESKDLTSTSICQSLCRSYNGGLPMLDGSKRDPAELLDVMASLMKKEKYCNVHRGGFFYLYCIGSFARNLSSSVIRCECGLNAMKRRLCGMNKNILQDTFTVSSKLMKDRIGTTEVLVDIVVQTCVRSVLGVDEDVNGTERSFWGEEWYESKNDDGVWNRIVKDLHQLYENGRTARMTID